MPTNTVGIDISPETIGHILHEKGLRVPLSQRSYRWEAEHVEDLYKDINAAVLEALDEYFVGSIVGIKSNGVTSIYDGQQRLATTMILIAAIRDYFHKAGYLAQGQAFYSRQSRPTTDLEKRTESFLPKVAKMGSRFALR